MAEQLTEQRVIEYTHKMKILIANILFSDKTVKAIIADLKQAPDPIAALPHICLSILESVKKQYGKPLPIEVIYFTGMIIVSDVIDVLNRSKQFKIAAEDIPSINAMVVQTYIQVHQAELDMPYVKAQLLKLQDAAKSGDLSDRVATATNLPKDKLQAAMRRTKPQGVAAKQWGF
jgi:hypothetical protein